MIRFGRGLWHINYCRLFNAKFTLYIYVKHIRLGLAEFCGISTTECYLMPNPLHTYIYNFVWSGFLASQTLLVT